MFDKLLAKRNTICIAMTLALAVALGASSAESQTFKTRAAFTGTGGTASGRNPLGSLTLSGTTL